MCISRDFFYKRVLDKTNLRDNMKRNKLLIYSFFYKGTALATNGKYALFSFEAVM